MDEGCFRIEGLEEVASLPTEDPRRSHLDRCPRCRTRLASYRAFVDGAMPEGADPVAGVEAMTRALRLEIFAGPQAPRESSAAVVGVDGLGFEERVQQFLATLFTRRLRPAWGVLAVMLCFLAVREGLRISPVRNDGINIRGTEDSELVPLAGTAEVLSEGFIQFRWTEAEQAERYDLIICAVDLREIMRIDAGVQTTHALRIDASIKQAGQRGPLFWRVSAMRDGVEIARSALIALEAGQ